MASASISSDPADVAAQDELTINASAASWEQLPVRTPPPPEKTVWHGFRPEEDGPLTVLVWPEALAQVQAHNASEDGVELGGVLLGRAYQHDGRPFVEVQAALPAVSDDHGPIHFTFTADAWAQLHQDRARNFPALDIIGWFHTHPGLGVFFSADDVVVHTAAFTMPWHVGLVVDPLRNEAGLFGWDEKEIVPLPGFAEVLPNGRPPLTPWQVRRAAVWDETYEAHLLAEERRRTQTPLLRRVASEPLWLDRFLLLAGGVAILLAVVLLALTLVGLNRRAVALESVALTLLDERMSQAEAAGLAACGDPDVRLLTPLPGQEIAAGTAAPVVGRALQDGARSYRVDVRPDGAEGWTELRTLWRDVRAGQLLSWDTAGLAAGAYELRLRALDGNEQTLASCRIEVNIIDE